MLLVSLVTDTNLHIGKRLAKRFSYIIDLIYSELHIDKNNQLINLVVITYFAVMDLHCNTITTILQNNRRFNK